MPLRVRAGGDFHESPRRGPPTPTVPTIRDIKGEAAGAECLLNYIELLNSSLQVNKGIWDALEVVGWRPSLGRRF